MKHPKENEYCAFKDDRARLHACVSRDVRFVAVAVLIGLGSHTLGSLESKALSVAESSASELARQAATNTYPNARRLKEKTAIRVSELNKPSDD